MACRYRKPVEAGLRTWKENKQYEMKTGNSRPYSGIASSVWEYFGLNFTSRKRPNKVKLQVINIRTELAGIGSNIPISIPKHFSFIRWLRPRWSTWLGPVPAFLPQRNAVPRSFCGFFKCEKLEQGYPIILQGTKSAYIYIYRCIYIYISFWRHFWRWCFSVFFFRSDMLPG